jgi:manganese/zinc/iron transport system permease protein
VTGWLAYNTAIVLAGTMLLGASCGLVGCFAVLRRRALLGDALAHAALPGVGVAFLLANERSMPVLLLGALVSGLLGVVIVAVLRFATRTKDDAAIGAVLGVASALGFVLIRVIQDRTTTGSKAGLASYILGKTAGMIAQDVYLMAAVSAGCLAIVWFFYKEFKAIAFDPGFAKVQGWPVLALDFLLTGLIAVAVVVGLPAVGGLLITALLIIPAVSARFWTDSLGRMLMLSTLLGGAIGACGTALSAQFSFSPAGPVIVLVGTAAFTGSMLLAPRRGLIARGLDEARFRRRLARQKLLRMLYELDEAAGGGPRPFELADVGVTIARIDAMARDGLATPVGAGRYLLTASGREQGARAARASRLWHLFLSEHADLAPSYADLDAERIDTILPDEMIRELESRLLADGSWPVELPPPAMEACR